MPGEEWEGQNEGGYGYPPRGEGAVMKMISNGVVTMGGERIWRLIADHRYQLLILGH